MSESFNKLLIVCRVSEKASHFYLISRFRPLLFAFKFCRSVLRPLSLMMWPRNVTERCQYEHFNGFNFKFALLSRLSAKS